MLTPSQIRWAASHDWFVAATKAGDGRDGVTVLEVAVYAPGVTPDDTVRFTEEGRAVTERTMDFFDYPSLRDWAGY
ncbi:hypothetical protein [uncultured Alsobacter sp.]|uniref:hypothetical protein n=1 Tax=uncultured Alsobacter sp. TaxID=1748258 RepID=UPI0025E2BD1B|nr:hypothetical protein [uncultured Alsobacter sp.]